MRYLPQGLTFQGLPILCLLYLLELGWAQPLNLVPGRHLQVASVTEKDATYTLKPMNSLGLKVGRTGRTRTGTHKAGDFLTTIAFATFTVCGLDYTFICSRWLPSSLYTFLFKGLARYWHFTAFTKFDNIHTSYP
jgi:hypothetical protein